MPPEDEDIRKESGLAGANMLNDLMEIMNISRTHRITIDITRDEWLDNIDTFEQLIESGIVSTIRIEGTKDNIVKLGEGGDRAIRETVETDHTDSLGVRDAFEKIEE